MILPGLFFNSLHIATTAMSVTRKVHLYAIVNLLTGIINVVLSLMLSSRYGVVGACVSISAAYIFRTVALNVISAKHLKLKMLEFSKKCYVTLTPPIIFSAAIGILLSDRFSLNWIGFIFKSAITVLAFAMFTLIFDAEFRRIVHSYCSKKR